MSYSKLLLSISTIVVMASYPAQAGFKWDTGATSSNTVVDDIEKQPVDGVVMEELSPVQQVEVVVEEQGGGYGSLHPVIVMDTIDGFGRDVPLSYAVSSIVPPSYAYAFGANVNTAQPITWKGGKPWDEVLEDFLSLNGLSVRVDGNKVVVFKQTQEQVDIHQHDLKILPIAGVEQPTTSPTILPTIDNTKSVGREVFVRRSSGDVVVVDKKKLEKTEVSVKTPIETPVNIIETKRLVVEEQSKEDIKVSVPEEIKVIEKINPDIPASVSSYQGNDENVFEMVVSEQSVSGVLDPKKISNFHAKSGQTVRGVIEKWSEEANVQVYWETKYDFPVEKSMALTATYPMAIQALLGRYESVDPRPTVKLHPNWPHGPSIITVK